MVITEIYGAAPPDALINAISANIAEKMKEEKEHEYLGTASDRPQMAGKAHPAADWQSSRRSVLLFWHTRMAELPRLYIRKGGV